jgi:hypothetical protein
VKHKTYFWKETEASNGDKWYSIVIKGESFNIQKSEDRMDSWVLLYHLRGVMDGFKTPQQAAKYFDKWYDENFESHFQVGFGRR